MITTTHLIRSIAASGVSVNKRVLRLVINQLVEEMSRVLESGRSLRLSRFGVFKTKLQQNKRAFIPYHNKHMVLPDTIRVRFRPMKKLMNRVNKRGTGKKKKRGRAGTQNLGMDAISQAL